MKPVVWTSRATKDLEKITRFYGNLYGFAKAREIITELRESTAILGRAPGIGEVDEAFSHLKRNYRKLINQHCKITYREGRTTIYVLRVFDTRQNPNKNRN